jgi:hypothetical protein
VLNGVFLQSFREDESALHFHPPDQPSPNIWQGREIPGELPNGFNMAEVEDVIYAQCMEGGKGTTARALQTTYNFQWKEANISQIDGVGPVVDPKALLEFAAFRGAKRAGLQQCLNHFANIETRAILSPWKKLFVPTHKNRQLREEEVPVDLGIIYRPKCITKIPPKQETFSFTFWYREYLKQTENWAEEAFEYRLERIEKAHGEFPDRD